MLTYIVRRLLESVVFVLVAGLVFYTAIVFIMPGGPYRTYESIQAAAARAVIPISGSRAEILRDYGQRYKLDRPWPISYLAWLFDPSDTVQLTWDLQPVPKGIDISLGSLQLKGSGILTGDFGSSVSYAQGVPLSQLLSDRWGFTLELVMLSLIVALAIALPLGILGAIRQRSGLDHTVTFFSFAGLSVPLFVLGLVFILFLAVLPSYWRNANGWEWLPVLPPGDIGDKDNWLDRLYHIVLPAMTLAIPQIGIISRYTRSSLIEVLKQDYIRTARAKGLSSRRVVFKHGLRNALIPLITMVGLMLPGLASGAIVVESVFARPGMGQLYYRALGGCLETQALLAANIPGPGNAPCPPIGFHPMDQPVALTMTLILIALVAFSNMLADVMYTVADPRIRPTAKA